MIDAIIFHNVATIYSKTLAFLLKVFEEIDLLVFHSLGFGIAGLGADDTDIVTTIHDSASMREPLGQAPIVKVRSVANPQLLELVVEVATVDEDSQRIH